MAAVVYHWKHGWIPLDHTSALSKAKGNHERAQQLVQAAHGSGVGIRSRQDIAKAVVDLPNVPEGPGRREARHQVTMAAVEHNAEDLLPPSLRATAKAVTAAQDRYRRIESQPVTARVSVRSGIYQGQTGHHIVGTDSRGRRVRVFVPGKKDAADRAAANIRAGRGAFAR